MIFNSFTFVVFFGIVLLLHRLPVGWTTKKIQLLVASYLFYAAWNPPFVLLLWISTVTDWYAARWIRKAEKTSVRRFFLILSLSANLGLLGVFKYGGFLLENFVWLMSLLNIEFGPLKPNIVLPVGISFYTFQSLSYTLDVYRKKLEPWPSFLDFAMFVTFFPQLVAGPIVRAADFLPQCRKPRQASFRQTAWGLCLLVSGLFQKVVLADALLAPVGDRVFDSAVQAGTVDAWTGILAFSGQIFFDFNGYSSCAIGSALCLGFVLPDNFRFPYGAVGFRDFWRRWHVSLSTWLKDYVYVSLGGSKKGRARTLANVMLTMLIGGLWHGASWLYVIWGAMHGALLVFERMIAERFGDLAFFNKTAGRLFLALTTYALLCVTWAFFRGADLNAALEIAGDMFYGGGANIVDSLEIAMVVLINAALLSGHFVLRDGSIEEVVNKMPWQLRAAALSFMLIAISLTKGDDRAFIYFQF